MSVRVPAPRALVFAAVALLALTMFCPAAWAQQSSGIAGVVRDTTGAVLPGVTVEASSPVLIEKTRTAITDSEGRYIVANLLSGTYTVTFTLPGFGTVRREGVELTSGFAATVNADMKVGGIEETVTVTGASPLVDVQNTKSQTVLPETLLKALPTSTGGLIQLITLTPGLTGATDVGGSSGVYRMMGSPEVIGYHGRMGAKMYFDGMPINNGASDGNVSYIVNSLLVDEMVLEAGGMSAENASSGFSMNAVPKQGGNMFSFSLTGLFSDDSMQGDNLDSSLRSRGVTSADKALNIYDTGLSVGGPIVRDKVHFFGAVRAAGSRSQKANVFANKTAGTPFYTADPSRPGERSEWEQFYSGRVTWQASAKNKFNVFGDLQRLCRCEYEGFDAPEAIFGITFWPQWLAQGTWSSPRTNNFLLEAGMSAAVSTWTDQVQPGASTQAISILELSRSFMYNANGAFASRSPGYWGHTKDSRITERFAASYVTGSHVFKTGVQLEHVSWVQNNDLTAKVGFVGERLGPVTYAFLNGVPNRITQWATPIAREDRVKADLGLFAQDQWRVKRLTLNYGVRFDYLNGEVPAQSAPAGPFIPARNFDAVHGVPLWKDVSPRLGAAYDLFGNNRTALKVALGRYVSRTGTSIAGQNNPFATSILSANRTWADTNGNYSPDCVLTNFAAHGECGAIQDANFGKNNPRATRYSDDVLKGWGVRPYSWNVSTEVQHQFAPRVSMTTGWYRTSFGNFMVADNESVSSSDYSTYCITAPSDPRLPGGGGYQVCGLYDIAPSKLASINNVVKPASDFGEQKNGSNFFSVNFKTQFGSGIVLGGGVDTGRTVQDLCFVVDSPGVTFAGASPANSGPTPYGPGATVSNTVTFAAPFFATMINGQRACKVVTPFSAQTQLKIHGSYPLPAGFVVSATLQNVSGAEYSASYNAPNSIIAPSLGRNLAVCGAAVVCTQTATVPLIMPQTQFEDRRNQFDVRLTKLFKMGTRMTAQANFDVYNVFNANSLVTVNQTYGGSWRIPVTTRTFGPGVLNPRLAQISGRLSF